MDADSVTVQLDRKDIELLAYYLWEYRGRTTGSPDRDWYRAEEVLAYKKRYPAPSALSCGLDDVATGSGATSGFTCFVLPSNAVPKFSHEAGKLLPRGRKEFHAKEMNKSESTHYERFLLLIREYLEIHPYSLVCSLGADRSWHSALLVHATEICNDVLLSLGIHDVQLAARLTKISPPLWTLSRLLRLAGNQVSLAADVDSDTEIGQLGTTSATIGGQNIGGTELLARITNGYSKKYFGDAPRFSNSASSIKILPSEQSFMIQAADVVGNFALAHASFALGVTTAGRQRKSEIFERIFGTQSPAVLACHAKRFRSDEIEPIAAGNLKFIVADHFFKSDLEAE